MNIRNKEGYMDRTPSEAIKAMGRNKQRTSTIIQWYTSPPYAGNVEENVQNSRFAVVENGYLPITPPLLYPQFLDDSMQNKRDLGVFIGIVLMSRCSEVWVFGEKISSGMRIEIVRAKHKGYKLSYFNRDCLESQSSPLLLS